MRTDLDCLLAPADCEEVQCLLQVSCTTAHGDHLWTSSPRGCPAWCNTTNTLLSCYSRHTSRCLVSVSVSVLTHRFFFWVFSFVIPGLGMFSEVCWRAGELQVAASNLKAGCFSARHLWRLQDAFDEHLGCEPLELSSDLPHAPSALPSGLLGVCHWQPEAAVPGSLPSVPIRHTAAWLPTLQLCVLEEGRHWLV